MPRPVKYYNNPRLKSATETDDLTPLEPVINSDHRIIYAFIIEQIGKPDDFIKLEIKDLWYNHYRVNIYRETRGKITLTDSFFVVNDRRKYTAFPPLKRRYFADLLPPKC